MRSWKNTITDMKKLTRVVQKQIWTGNRKKNPWIWRDDIRIECVEKISNKHWTKYKKNVGHCQLDKHKHPLF
jgi:hypothetical protein